MDRLGAFNADQLAVQAAVEVAQFVGVQNRSRGGGLFGDWRIKMQFGEREFESILAFSRNQERQYTGQWISFFGVTELDDVKFEDNKLSFTLVTRFGGDERTSKFTGTVQRGELEGRLVSDDRDTEVKGKRAPRTPRGVGSWDMTINAGEREFTGILAISADEQGNLSGMWKSSRGDGKLLDVKYQDRKLTYTRVIEREGKRMELDFEGTLGFMSLEGTYKGDGIEATATGTRIGAAPGHSTSIPSAARANRG